MSRRSWTAAILAAAILALALVLLLHGRDAGDEPAECAVVPKESGPRDASPRLANREPEPPPGPVPVPAAPPEPTPPLHLRVTASGHQEELGALRTRQLGLKRALELDFQVRATSSDLVSRYAVAFDQAQVGTAHYGEIEDALGIAKAAHREIVSGISELEAELREVENKIAALGAKP